MTDTPKDPCGNEDCDLCNPLPRWSVSTETVVRRKHEREIKAATAEDALRIYSEGTAWPSDYDTRTVEVLEALPTKAQPFGEAHPARAEFRGRFEEEHCYHNLGKFCTGCYSLPAGCTCEDGYKEPPPLDEVLTQEVIADLLESDE